MRTCNGSQSYHASGPARSVLAPRRGSGRTLGLPEPYPPAARARPFRRAARLPDRVFPAGALPLAHRAVDAEERAPYSPAPRLLDRVRIAIRTRHLRPRTEEAYVFWIRRFILFHRNRHPADMAAPEVTAFLSSLAVDGHVAASTQNQAL